MQLYTAGKWVSDDNGKRIAVELDGCIIRCPSDDTYL